MKSEIYYLLIIYVFACCSSKESSRYKLIDKDSGINFLVQNTENERGVLILNSNYIVSGACPLDYDKVYPDWIVEDTSNLVFSSKNSVFIPTIYDIRPPYELIKKKNTDFFEIIKFKDTLKFRIIEF